jgi:hypothetical protein
VLGGAFGLGETNCNSSEPYCPLNQLALGIGLGALAAIVLDASILAWTPAPERADATSAALRVAPMIASDGKSGELRVFGSF